jgi:lysine 2,3-aminomutase
MQHISARQREVIEQLEHSGNLSRWRDWRWQLRNSITDLETLERLLGI